jgi:Alpha-L-fucosidase
VTSRGEAVAFLPQRESLDLRPVPRWYTDAKLRIFVHWGLYSIPAFAERTDGDFTAFMRDLTLRVRGYRFLTWRLIAAVRVRLPSVPVTVNA